MIETREPDMVTLNDLENPTPSVRLFHWDEGRVERLIDRMLEIPFMVDDSKRDRTALREMLLEYATQSNGLNVMYEWGDLDMLGIFANIVPGSGCHLLLKMANPGAFGREFVREGRDLLKKMSALFGLKEIRTNTADDKIMKLVRLFGFEEYGLVKDGLSFDGKPYDKHLLVYREN